MRQEKSRPTMKSRRHGYTLVELLVVVGIMAVLISILLPALTKARESAVRVNCLSNLRQVGISIALYAQENKGFVPAERIDNDYAFNFTYYLNAAGKGWSDVGLMVERGYLTDGRVLYCPDQKNEALIYETQWNDPTQKRMGYLYRFRANDITPTVKMHRLARKAMMYDQVGHAEWTFIAHRARGANVLYGDGSALWCPEGEKIKAVGIASLPNWISDPQMLLIISWFDELR